MKQRLSNEYVNLPRPVRPEEPTPLEMIIYQYELKACDFHNGRNRQAPANETAAQKAERIAKRDRDWQHLRLERRKIAAHVKMQENLTAYREENKTKSVRELATEKHHPTKLLARNLQAVGEPKPTPMHEPHHVIPGAGKHQKVQIMRSRLNLHAFGVGINDPLNGIWLRNFAKNTPDDWTTPEAPAHRPLHTFNYETWISSLFSNDNLPESVFISRLQSVKRKLRDGTHPDNILQRKTS